MAKKAICIILYLILSVGCVYPAATPPQLAAIGRLEPIQKTDRIITRHKKFKVFSGRKMIKPEGMGLELNAQELILKVPLKILGEPDFILTAVKTYAGFPHTDTTSFRKINIERRR